MAEDFAFDISKWAKGADDKSKLFVLMFCTYLIRYIQSHTPVLTGRLRASIGAITPLGDWTPGHDITIGTNVEYARRIEYGFVGEDRLGRHYDQKGVGMFAAGLAIAPQLAELVAKQTEGYGIEGIEEVIETLLGEALEVAEIGAVVGI